MNQNREELRRSRDYWKTRAEEEERLQKTKEEAWRLFERMPGFKRKTRETFEEEFTRKVKNALGNSRKEREKAVQEWSDDMQKLSSRKNGNARPGRGGRMEQEDSNSKDGKHGRKYGIRESSPCRRSLLQETEPRRQTGR